MRRAAGWRVALLAGACAAALLAGSGAQAQQGGSLRAGQAADPADAAALRALADTQVDPSPADAMPEDDPLPPTAGDGLFDNPVEGSPQDDIFADPPRPEPRAPSTRLARRTAPEPALPASQAAPPRLRGDGGEDPASQRPAAAPNTRVTPARIEPDIEPGLETPETDARALREPPVEAMPRLPSAEEDPFAPVGLRAGTFILRPSVETGITASSNSTRTAGGSSGVLSETTLRLDAQSDWSEHSAAITGAGTFRRSLSGDEVKEVEGAVDANLRFDLGHDWQARAGLSYSVEPESASDPDGVSGAETQPLDQSLEARAGLDKDLGALRLSGTASVARDWYGEAELADGGTLDQSGRDSTLALLTLRTGYQLSPALTPFIEVEGGRRIYDENDDRSANRLGARLGVALAIDEKWTGELAAGWLRESFDSDALDPIEGPSLRAALEWSPVRGTAVSLNAVTSVEGSTTEGESGSLVQDLRLDVERRLRANLSAEAGLGASYRRYVGSDGRDLTLSGELGLTWWLNRDLGLSGRLRHERLESNQPGREYRENSVFLGTKFQY